MDIRKECERRRWRLLNEKPSLDCENEDAFERHVEENLRILEEMEQMADKVRGLWSVTRRFIDPAHESVKVRRRFVEPYDLQEFIEAADLKNGVDSAIAEDDGALIIIANGRGYTTDSSYEIVTTVFECRLLDSWTAEATRAFEFE